MNKSIETTTTLFSKLTSQLLITLVLTTASPLLLAQCVQPDPPTIPSDEEMSPEKMAAIQETVTTYMAEAKNYLNCTRRKKKRDDTIDEMRLVAANYNVLIQFYREYRDSLE